MKVVLVAVPLINTRIPPLSIAMLAGQLKRDGHEVKSFDFNIESYWAVSDELKTYWTYYKGFQWLDNTHFETYIYPNIIGQFIDGWCQRILDEKPDIVGISVTASPSGTKLAERLKQINPDIKIVEFDLPVRDEATLDYRKRVDDWHDAIAQVWAQTIAAYPSMTAPCGLHHA